MLSKYVSNNLQRDFRIPVSAFVKVARKSFNAKFTAKIGFRSRFYVTPLLMLTLEV